MKTQILRTCMGCSKKEEKSKFLRIVINKNKEISIDKKGKLLGRGAYICHSEDCLNKVIKTKKLERVFKTVIDNETYENIRNIIVHCTLKSGGQSE